MKRRCSWLNSCPQPVVQRVGYWGEWHDLCAEHAEILGDDGSMDDLEEQVS